MPGARRCRRSWNEVTPCSSQHTTSPSIRQERTLRWFTASTTRGALRPVVAPAGDQPDAHGVAACHQPDAVVLDLVNPVEAGRGLSAGDGRHGSMKLARSADKRLRIRSINIPLI